MTKQVRLREGSWQLLQLLDSAPGLQVLADTLNELTLEGHEIVALTADLKHSNGLVRFADCHPERFFQFGISEQSMVTAAAGMAASGLRPVVGTFASFLALLCCEQIRTDVAYQNLPVCLVGHHAGIALGFYGTSHHATEDLAIMRAMANLTVVAPADAYSLAAALRAWSSHDGPVYLRIGRGRESDVYETEPVDFAFGRSIRLRDGDDVGVIATGSMVHPARDAIDALREDGVAAELLDMHTIKPIDRDAIVDLAARVPVVVTVEEHNVIGGLGGAVAEVLAEIGSGCRLVRHGIPDTYSLIGPPTHLYAHYGLDAPGISEVIRRATHTPD